jgi:hypothetical protein
MRGSMPVVLWVLLGASVAAGAPDPLADVMGSAQFILPARAIGAPKPSTSVKAARPEFGSGEQLERLAMPRPNE